MGVKRKGRDSRESVRPVRVRELEHQKVELTYMTSMIDLRRVHLQHIHGVPTTFFFSFGAATSAMTHRDRLL